MKRLTKFLLFFVFFSSIQNRGNAQVINQVSPEELYDEVSFICDTSNKGRQFGSPQLQAISFYLLRYFRNCGYRTTVQSFEYQAKVGHNIVAISPGFFHKYIVLGAYYDGLGVLSGSLYPGADSNASGLASLVSLASRLKATGDTGLIIVAFDGHNASLSGSKAFLDEYKNNYTIERIINFDILGSDLVPLSKNRPEYLIALGAVPQMFSLDRINANYHLDIAYDYYGSSTFTELFYEKISDQSHFVQAKIPAIMFTSGITDNTNKVTDTIETINFPLFAKRVNFILDWIKTLL